MGLHKSEGHRINLPERLSIRLSVKLSIKIYPLRKKAVMKLIATNPSITQKEMAKQLKLTEIGIRYNTSKLKSKGILQRTGGKKTGRCEVVK